VLIERHDPFHALSLVIKATLPRFCIFAASEWSGVAFSFLTHKGEIEYALFLECWQDELSQLPDSVFLPTK
jgi:hypothetical protein